MHEQRIAQAMIEIALHHAEANQARRVLQMGIEMSEAADESEDSLCFYLENLTRGTIAENARFEITRVGLPVRCKSCGHAYEQHAWNQPCPRCADTRVESSKIEEFRLKSIQIE